MSIIPTLSPPTIDSLRAELGDRGYARLSGRESFALLDAEAWGWDDFAQTWNDLGPDLYMADGGRYRRRRHAAFRCERGNFTRKPHQPHFQSRDHNRLNGDVQRWFDPVEPKTVANDVMQSVLAFCADLFDPGGRQVWHVEMHQFRIEAGPGEAGRPTPEGLHRDGVDRVFVMLVERRNVDEGVTRIGTRDGMAIGAFTLAEPGDAILIDDHRILHGVTEIHTVDATLPAWRDALVVTFAAER